MNLISIRSLTYSEVHNSYLTIPRQIKLPFRVFLEIYDDRLEGRVDNRNRMYVSKLFKRYRLKVGLGVNVYQKNENTIILKLNDKSI